MKLLNLNAEFLSLLGNSTGKERYDAFLLGVDYAARICLELAQKVNNTDLKQQIHARFYVGEIEKS